MRQGYYWSTPPPTPPSPVKPPKPKPDLAAWRVRKEAEWALSGSDLRRKYPTRGSFDEWLHKPKTLIHKSRRKRHQSRSCQPRLPMLPPEKLQVGVVCPPGVAPAHGNFPPLKYPGIGAAAAPPSTRSFDPMKSSRPPRSQLAKWQNWDREGDPQKQGVCVYQYQTPPNPYHSFPN